MSATFGSPVAPPARCDGCGTETSGATTHTSDDGVTVLATYCPGCEALLRRHRYGDVADRIEGVVDA